MACAADHIDYEAAAAAYARNRAVHPGVVADLVRGGGLTAASRVLDVGCGTGNYARAVQEATGCAITGIEPSDQMRERAGDAARWTALVAGAAETLPFPDGVFDLVYSTDVIHHVGNRPAFFAEALRVLAPGGRIATATDSRADIARRRPLSNYFPETVAVEERRYPATETLQAEMAAAGFADIHETHVELEYPLTDVTGYRERAYSSLLLIDEAAHQRGVARMEQDLAAGPIPALSLYTLVWGTHAPDGLQER
ncbi:MAG: class I SAM-dependent methyltransferase [Thermomicrobiales bacterium]